MTPAQCRNFDRLLKPKHIAVIGGRDAEVVIKECERIAYRGDIWPVNPKRDQISGYRCYASIHDLPQAPDAVFLAIPRNAALQTIAELNTQGAGGVVCYTAGFGEVAHDDGAGAAAEQVLIEAAGDMAIIGPNCYGLINYLDQTALWPFAHGGHCPGYGAAIITQSGMLSSDLTMNQRSTPLAYMISAGNQAVLGIEDFIEAMLEQEAVRAIGLHIEGLRDINRFIQAAATAIQKCIPIVALKTGSSAIGSQLTVSHTGSLSGRDDCYQALFDRLGIIRVHSPAQLLETLKYLCIAGVPKNNKLAGFTCSGGGATMLADHAEKIGLQFPSPTIETAKRLKKLLPPIATVSNPLDYTTPIWGDAENLPPVFQAMFKDEYGAAIMVQDYPLPGLDESKQYYLNDAISFMQTTRAAKLPAAVCSTLPENIDLETREFLISKGVAPMQGIHETLNAIAAASRYGQRREQILQNPTTTLRIFEPSVNAKSCQTINEWHSKQLLRQAGLTIPDSQLISADEIARTYLTVNLPVVVKLVSDRLIHKTEAAAVVLNLSSIEEIEHAIKTIQTSVKSYQADIETEQFLIEEMMPKPTAQLLVGIRNDSQFGFVLTLASGGVLTELIQDAVTLLLPINKPDLDQALSGLKISSLLDGFRGQPAVNRSVLVNTLYGLCEYVQDHADTINEIEINPLFVYAQTVCAVDAVVRANIGGQHS